MGFDKTIVIVGATASGKTGVAISIAKAMEMGVLSDASGSSSDISLSKGAILALRMSNTATRLKSLPAGRHFIKESKLSLNSVPTAGRSVSPFFSNYAEESSGIRKPIEGLRAEVISADSRAIYKGMDIGTAKPSREEQQGIPHWGIDLVEPGERFTVADWKSYTEKKIAEIRERGNLPLVVGGTGLYVDALVYDYSFTEEGKRTQNDRQEVCANYLIIGVKWGAETLRKRIAQRVDKLFVQELFEETKKLAGLYNWNTQAMKSNIYQFAWGYLQGEYSLERAKELCTYDDWHLAKRQLTWFKRNKNIVWLPLAEIEPYVIKCIQDEQRR